MPNPIIGIVGGKGRMGKLFANFFKEHGIKVLISDKNTKLENKDLAEKADITIISVPIDKTVKVIEELLPYIKEGAAIMDLTSIKKAPLKAMLKGDCEVMGIHPMFGNSNPIPGQTIFISKTKKSDKWSEWMKKFLIRNKAIVKEITPKAHDKLMSVCQGLIHFADIAFVHALNKTNIPIKDIVKFSSKASEIKVQLAARLIAQDPNLYGNIQIANPDTLKILKKYKKSIDDLIKIIEKKNLKKFIKYFLNSRKKIDLYAKEAYKDSSFIIDKFIEFKNKTSKKKKVKAAKNNIALLGPPNTFSDIAATKYLKESELNKLEKYYCNNISEIFELVEKGKVDRGLVPIESMTYGTVRETQDALFYKKVHIINELSIPVHHNLITLQQTKLKDIKEIYSHPQAINSCTKFIKKQLSKAEKIPSTSTAAAVQKIQELNKISSAAIGSEMAANKSDLKILALNIEDNKENRTKFLLIKKGKYKEYKGKNTDKISIVFYFDKNKAGSLYKIFETFAKAAIDLSKVESRPAKTNFGNYLFYIDFTGNPKDKKIKKTLKTIEKMVAELKILGTY